MNNLNTMYMRPTYFGVALSIRVRHPIYNIMTSSWKGKRDLLLNLSQKQN